MNGAEFSELRERMARLEEKAKNIESDVKWIMKRLQAYRPPWSVVVLITFLSCVSVGLIVRTLA